MTLRYLALLAICLALCGCDKPPSAKAISTKFIEDHPGVTVIAVRTGKGDNDGLEYFIDYTSPTERTPQTAQWLVHWGSFNDWGYSEDEFKIKK